MREPIVAGNWKMNGNAQSIAKLLAELKLRLSEERTVHCIVFPPAVYLQQVVDSLKNTSISCGIQNISQYLQGAYTGEISAAMLRDFACNYVLVGHSERRHLFHETDEIIAQKFMQALHHDVIPVLCVGETLQQRQEGLTDIVISKQLNRLLEQENGVKYFSNAIVAYEPVWAIGSGVTATPEQAQAVHANIRQVIASQDSFIADKLPILYGGSVKANNAAELFAMPDIDGGLVGGAALDAAEFVEIVRCIN